MLDDVEKKHKYIKDAEQLNIQVVPVDFINECQKGGSATQLIDSMNLVSWGSDVSNVSSVLKDLSILIHVMLLTDCLNLFYYLQPTSRMSADVVDSKSKSKSSM